MEIATKEVERLLAFQSQRHFNERRVETLTFAADRHYIVHVKQQYVIPKLSSDAGDIDEPLIVPLGHYAKARRGDLVVQGHDGSLLPTMLRSEGAVLLAHLVLAATGERFRTLAAASEDDPLARALVRALWAALRGVAFSPPRAARDHILDLAAAFTRIHAALAPDAPLAQELRDVIHDDLFWEELGELADTTTVLAQVVARPGRAYVLQASYRDWLTYERQFLPGRVLRWLGMSTYSIERWTPNANYVRSLWVIASVPPGVEIVRYFWAGDRGVSREIDSSDPARAEDAVIQESFAVIGHRGTAEDDLEPRLAVDVQIAPSASATAALTLAAIALFITAYIYQGVPRLEDGDARAVVVSVAGLFSALPAAIAGGLAYRGDAFARYVTRGPRVMVGILAASTGLLAAIVSLRSLHGIAEWLALCVSTYCVFMIGVFLHIAVGPRARKSSRSRWKRQTRWRSSVACRRLQMKWAWIGLACTAFACLVYVRCLYVLQDERVFTDEFPGNVWNAWWSWF